MNRQDYVLTFLDLLLTTIRVAPHIQEHYTAMRHSIETMIAENRNPTEAEWRTLNERIDALRQELHDSLYSDSSEDAPPPKPNIPMLGFSMTDLDTMARTLYGEAEQKNELDAVAIAWVIRNRVEYANRWRDTVDAVCRQRWQFSCWERVDEAHIRNNDRLMSITEADPWFRRCITIASNVLNGREIDPTVRATHYYATWIDTPKWATGKVPCYIVRHGRPGGEHRYFNDIDTPKPKRPLWHI